MPILRESTIIDCNVSPLKCEIAIKVILPQYANQPDFIRRFEVEAEPVACLEHPHIVPPTTIGANPTGRTW